MRTRALVLPLLLAVPHACRAQAARPTTVRVPEAWLRMQGDVTGMSAGYLTIQNTGTTPVVVRGVRCPNIRLISMHESLVQNGMVRMVARDSLVVPPGDQLVMRPGGLHLMLMGLARPLSAGERVRCVVQTRSGDIPVEAVVRAS